MSCSFFDHQVNGFAGVDFQQSDLDLAAIEHALHALHRHQTDRILYTLITDRVDALCAKIARIEGFRAKSAIVAETIVGYHVEGPYLLPEEGYHGAHDPRLMKAPEIPEFERMWEASQGRIRLITLAPEWPGSPEFVRHVADRGVRVAIGHSNADERAIDEAIGAGLTLCTHLGNGVPAVMHRHDNIIQRLLARDELYAAFIPDGIHLPPGVLKNLVRAKPPEKVIFTTDCMAAAGAPPGRYRIGRLEVEVGPDRVVREPGKMNFAGSALTMDAAAENVRRFLGWTGAQALAACSDRVAGCLGISQET